MQAVIDYKGVLIEVSFQMADVVALTGLAEPSRVMLRASSENLAALRGLNIVDFPGAVSAKLGDAERERAEKGAGGVMVPLKHSA